MRATPPLINHVDYRFACIQDKVRLEVKVDTQDWVRPTNRCGDEDCRIEPACSSESGRHALQSAEPFDSVTLDLACYNGRLYRRRLDAKGYFKIERYKGPHPLVCAAGDNSQFTAAYFKPVHDLSVGHAHALP